MSFRRGLAVFVAAMAGAPAAADACAVCGAGDPTLTVMGNEKTFAGRARVSADLRVGDLRVGTPGVDEIGVSEERLELAAAYAPTHSILLVLAVPLLHREAAFDDGRSSTWWTIGDVELRVKGFVWTTWRDAFQHRIALQGGLKAPSGPVERDDKGAPLPTVLQPGMGAVTPYAGLFYGMGHAPWSFYASITAYLPYAIRDSAHASDSLRASATVQRQVGRTFAARIGVDTRLDASGESNGKPDPTSGGFVAYLSPALVVSPVTDLLLTVGAHTPFVQAFHGPHHEATIATFGVTYDF